MTIVFPVHNGDIDLAIRHAVWLTVMTDRKQYRNPAIVAHDPTLNREVVGNFVSMLKRSFSSVSVFRYPRPMTEGWPMACNWAWQAVAQHMTDKEHWLWMEADAIALKPGWLEVIEQRYLSGAMPFLGPKVEGMAHVNGVAVYPRNTPDLLPSAMRSTSTAWDYEAGPDMIDRTTDASDIMQHVWSVDEGRWSQVGGGQIPMLVTKDELKRNLNPAAVLLHRIKDHSVLSMLISGTVKP